MPSFLLKILKLLLASQLEQKSVKNNQSRRFGTKRSSPRLSIASFQLCLVSSEFLTHFLNGQRKRSKSYMPQCNHIAGSDVAQVTTIRVRAGEVAQQVDMLAARNLCSVLGTHGERRELPFNICPLTSTKHLHPCTSTHKCASTYKCALNTREHTCTQTAFKVKLLPLLTS